MCMQALVQAPFPNLQPPLAQRAMKKLTQAFAQPPNGTASEHKLAQAPFPTAWGPLAATPMVSQEKNSTQANEN